MKFILSHSISYSGLSRIANKRTDLTDFNELWLCCRALNNIRSIFFCLCLSQDLGYETQPCEAGSPFKKKINFFTVLYRFLIISEFLIVLRNISIKDMKMRFKDTGANFTQHLIFEKNYFS